ncbi:hypothetical protein Hamer_G010040 [Homarus americanus]|uniref:Uncharacterized protein n=1 Tax=Homarus americanus TaxID=6706 RepID=A0A8J5JKG7_HOMAM|nr:hypothetical protein Hamer_G010040 [Homarus americanus]
MKYVGASVKVSGSMVFQGKKEDFLYNVVNKQKFIYLLADHLTQSCCVKHAKADADLVIVQNAIALAHKTPNRPTIVVADDHIDILIGI